MTVKMFPKSGRESVDSVKEAVKSAFSKTTVKDEHMDYVHFQVTN